MKRLDDLREDRALRDAARESFDANVAQVKADFAARGIGGRIAARVTREVRTTAVQAAEIADDNRGIVVGTLSALAFWFARKPLQRLAAAVKARFSD